MRRFLLMAGMLAIALIPRAVHAADALSGYTITSWNHRDGLPAGTVWALAQDRDGFLWLGCDAGLLRFDGSRFSTWDSLSGTPLPASAARALLAHSDGTLWVGFEEPGGVSQIRGREVRTYGESDGLPRGQIRMLVEDRRGTVWAGTTRGVFRFTDGRWQAVTNGFAADSRGVYSGYTTRDGSLLVGTVDGIYRYVAERDRFEALDIFGPVDGGVRGIAQDGQGRLVATDVTAGFRRVQAGAAARDAERGRGLSIIADRVGVVWVATGGHGIWRVPSVTKEPVVQKANTAAGLLAEGAYALLEDRDGNIWAGTSDGLSRFTRQAVETFTDFGVTAGIQASSDGRVWIATFDGLNEFARQNGAWRMVGQHFAGRRVRAVHADGTGRLWAATENVVARFDPGRPTPTILLSSTTPLEVESITTDADGRVGLFDSHRGWVRIESDGRVVPIPVPQALAGLTVLLARVDRSGRLWLTFREGGVGTIQPDGRVQLFGADDGASAGVYRAFHEDASGAIWLGGRSGLSRYADGRFTTVSSTRGLPDDYVKAVVQDEQGMLWLGTSIGILRISPAEYDQALAGRNAQLIYHTIDKQDGVAGSPRLLSDRSATRDADGALWFVTGGGVTRVDPNRFVQESNKLRAQVVGVTVDGQSGAPESGSRLAAGASKIEIDYSALNLTAPHRTRFRYRLEGFDREWVYADLRRTAFYTNLPPGDYSFRVAASETGSSWSEGGDSWTFSIRPHFYQTGWFPMVGAVALVLPVWGLWQLRSSRMREQFAILLRERMRLSREIHDTLLQSMVGVALQCDVLASETDSPRVKGKLTQLRKRVEEYIDECRQCIWDLRSPMLEHRDLVSALKRSGERATAGSGVEFIMSGSGPTRRPAPQVEQQLLRIAQEAIANAVRHAGASSIHLQLEEADAALTLRVVDNGRGFDPDARVREANGHCGLAAMKERAREVNGSLNIKSAPGLGAEITAVVPFAAHARAS